MSQIPESKLGDYRHITSDTKLTAALTAMGVPLKKDVPCSNEYDENRPCRYPKTDPRWRPGKVKFHLEGINKDGISIQKFIEAYFKGGKDVELDELVDQINKACADKNIGMATQLALRIKDCIPFAQISAVRIALENRERLIDLVKQAQEIIITSKGAGNVLTSKNPTSNVIDQLL